MKISDFATQVAMHEGQKKEMSIAQIKEVLRVVDDLLCKQLYKLIRKA